MIDPSEPPGIDDDDTMPTEALEVARLRLENSLLRAEIDTARRRVHDLTAVIAAFTREVDARR